MSATDSGPERRALIRRKSEEMLRLPRGKRLQRTVSVTDIVTDSLRKALGGGLTGAAAMSVQVVTLMWMRTTVAYQYRYGSTTSEALSALWKQGGVRRFYAGVSAALLQAPLSRFGDTAANTGVMALLNANESTTDLPTGVKTLASASAATLWRITLMPLDTLKSILQVEGAGGMALLRSKLSASGPAVLYHGASGLITSAFLGHYFWYGTFNAADAWMPVPTSASGMPMTFARNATVGFMASAVADTLTNSVRVLKTFRQTSSTPVSYGDAARTIIKSDGVAGLLGRGLATRLLSNGLQAALFSAIWKALQQKYIGGDGRRRQNRSI